VLLLAPLLVLSAYLRHPLFAESSPSRIAAALHDTRQPVRVLNNYNIAGYLREFGGDKVRVAIDGRADRYGAAAIERYGNALDGERGWERELAKYDPDAAVIPRDSALVQLLTDRKWRLVMVDHDWALLVPPDSKLNLP
jgi:hypothetical protein